MERYFRIGFIGTSGLFVFCITLQVLFAGMALFVNPSNWRNHATFVHYFEYLPILMLLFAIFGKLPAKVRWQCLGLLGLIVLQYATAKVSADFPSLHIFGALHPVIALVLFWMSVHCFRKARNAGLKTENHHS
jgi:hypothetical protein